MPGSQAAVPDPTGGDTAANERDEALWRTLLQLVEYGEVVPIVGRELLQAGDPPTHLYRWLAERVAKRLAVTFDPAEPAKDPLNLVACRYLEHSDDTRQIYRTVFEEAAALTTVGIPEAFQKLAGIDNFKLFVTTTFDTSLRRAIDTVRFNGLEKTSVRSFAPKKVRDLTATLDALTVPTVFHLLGQLSPTEDFVVTEEDALEFVHSLQQALPATLFGELYQKDLLVIGCRFPSWLVRSILRLARPSRLRQSSGRTVFLVDTGAREDQALIEFLRTFKTRTEVFERESPVEFVNELHERWRARVTAVAAAPPLPPLPEAGSIFISYASEDRGVAEQIAKTLAEAKLEAWFDREQLMAGDLFMERIGAGIRRSDLFIPLLSRHSQALGERYFRKEWKAAFDKASGLPNNVKFILPVVIDDLPHDAPELPPELTGTAVTWYRLQGITQDFVDTIKKRYRLNQTD